MVQGVYASVERLAQVDNGAGGAKSRWSMATASDAKGVLPQWVQKKAVPDAIAKDVKFVTDYLREKYGGEGWPAGPAVVESVKGQELSFTEIAKIVGERWQVLPTDAREACERQANTAKEKYYAEMAEYKKTPQYDAYQKYLEEFKAKHAAQHKGECLIFSIVLWPVTLI